MSLDFIYTGFENASPINWEVDDDGTVHIKLLYDHERCSTNRAAGHWYVQLHGDPGTDLTVMLENFDNVWNDRKSSPISDRTNCFLSSDGNSWSSVPAEKTTDNHLRFQVHMDTDKLYLARLEPYTLSDLSKLIAEIQGHQLVGITSIGQTVEGRELEIIRVGKLEAPYRVLLRARSHAWEPGGNWVIQGLVKNLLQDNNQAQQYLDRYCVYIMPIANKDGVAHGYTRFNVMGKDLNRDWDRPADVRYAPENCALENWLDGMIQAEMCPHLGIDLHNDNGGRLHLSRPENGLERYLNRMEHFESLMFQHTWFTEGSTGSNFRNPGTFGEGLFERYGIVACILELNCDWIAGLKKIPFGKDWELLGEQMCRAFFEYFGDG
ncbi:M14 family zinc carboxypeptidase [Candidatus Poribacteria bacterium]